MCVFKVKRGSQGEVTRRKTRAVVRGDLQRKSEEHNTWAPAASMRLVKYFIAQAAKHGMRVRQIDFIAAYLQAKVRARIYVKLPSSIKHLFSEEKQRQYFDKPLKLKKGLYGLTTSGRFWYEELQEWLIETGFKQSIADPGLFIWRRKDKFIALINYVDDMAYTSNDETFVDEFEKIIKERFNVTIKGDIDWYLSMRIKRHDKDYVIDQHRYTLTLLERYLSGLKNNIKERDTPTDPTYSFSKNDSPKIPSETTQVQKYVK